MWKQDSKIVYFQLAFWKIFVLYMALYGALTEPRRSLPSGMGVLAQNCGNSIANAILMLLAGIL